VIEPTLLAAGALVGVDVGLSVSDSADLARLGLSPRHAQLAVGELTRAVLVAGGRVVYGGRIKPSGFTQQLMAEIRRFGTSRHSLTVCLALPEHLKLTGHEIDELDRDLGTWGRLVRLDIEGTPISSTSERLQVGAELAPDDRARAYSGLRKYMMEITDTRVLVGGQLRGYQGVMPGLVEEAVLSIGRGQPVYVAGGFGGAAALIAQALGSQLDWMPADLPEGRNDSDVKGSIDHLVEIAARMERSADEDGLTRSERAQFVASHRPADIASLAVLGMARRFRRDVSVGTDVER
jgi:hypothetical protein